MNAPDRRNTSRSRRNLAKLWLNLRMPLVAVVVLGTALGGGSFVWDAYQSGREASLEKEFQAAEVVFFEAISSPVRRYIKSVDAALASNDATAALASADRAAMVAVEQALSAATPGAKGVRLIDMRRREPDDAGVPPISFATLDLIRGSKKSGEQPPVEVHLYGTEGEHLAIIRRINDASGGLAGHALFAFALDDVKAAVSSVSLPLGYAELSQRLSTRRPLRLASTGDTSLRGGVVRTTLRLPGTILQIRFYIPQASDAGLELVSGLVPVVGGVVLLGVFGALGGMVAYRRRRIARGSVMLGGAASGVVVEDEEPEGAFAAATKRLAQPSPKESISMEVQQVGRDGAAAAVVNDDMDSPGPQWKGDVGGMVVVEELPGLADSIFRAYDIRGVVDEGLTADGMRLIGQAIGTEAFEQGQQTLAVARDGRLSSDELHAALIEGLVSTGRDVIDVGRVPTPVLYFATYFLNTGSGVMVTGSHNPPQYNGLKTMLGGDILFGGAIQNIKKRALSGTFSEGAGQVQTMDLVTDYIRRVTEDMPVALGNALNIVVDCGNGAASEVAPKLIRALGHDVIELYCEMDGNFPNHHPDPCVPENLQDLIAAVRDNNADLGLAFDGDGDRLGVVDDTGEIIWADRLMMVYAKDILSRHPGSPVVYDVKCTSRLRTLIEANGGQPVMDKTGHSFMRNKLHETGAQLAGELSGHIFFKERWYGFDDAMYAAARLIEIIMLAGKKSSELFAQFPTGVTTPELRADMPEGEHFALMERLMKDVRMEGAELFTIDGLRAEFSDGWGLVRASNTTPSLVFRFEADNDEALLRIQGRFRALLQAVDSGLSLPF
jgi:phosphomannomutase/phosphoglucomutase